MITKASEEYLKTMYVLKKQNGNIRVTDIANKMNCTKPSVNKALNNLKEEKLVKYETYGIIELTEQGENLAQKILEAYDIVYLFLKDVLDLDEQSAKEEAEKIKLVTTDETINKLAKYVHNVLGLKELNCNYDINQEKCRLEKAKKALELIEKFEERIDTMKAAIDDNTFPASSRYLKDFQFAKIALNRLVHYYQKLFSNEISFENTRN